jgi:histidine triad (HIT) family protein
MPFDLPEREPCPFCQNVAGRSDCAVVERLPATLAFVHPHQFGRGHLLVVTTRHAETILDLEGAEATAVMYHVHRLVRALARALDPAGINIFQNNGVIAGQSIPHYHVHIVPSYPGDAPGRMFRSDDYGPTPLDERLEIAQSIASHLPPAS